MKRLRNMIADSGIWWQINSIWRINQFFFLFSHLQLIAGANEICTFTSSIQLTNRPSAHLSIYIVTVLSYQLWTQLGNWMFDDVGVERTEHGDVIRCNVSVSPWIFAKRAYGIDTWYISKIKKKKTYGQHAYISILRIQAIHSFGGRYCALCNVPI